MDSIKLDPEVKERWALSLEGGTYQQTRSKLYDGAGYCCLGVLAREQGCTFEPIVDETEDDEGNWQEVIEGYTVYDCISRNQVDNDDLLETSYALQFGISDNHQQLFSSLNDASSSTVGANNPLYDIWVKLADEVKPTQAEAPTGERPPCICYFHRPRTFAEIAAVIREHF
jgi:hypothetical protein